MFTILGILCLIVLYGLAFIFINHDTTNMGIAVVFGVLGLICIGAGMIFNHPVLLLGVIFIPMSIIHAFASDEYESALYIVKEIIKKFNEKTGGK